MHTMRHIVPKLHTSFIPLTLMKSNICKWIIIPKMQLSCTETEEKSCLKTIVNMINKKSIRRNWPRKWKKWLSKLRKILKGKWSWLNHSLTIHKMNRNLAINQLSSKISKNSVFKKSLDFKSWLTSLPLSLKISNKPRNFISNQPLFLCQLVYTTNLTESWTTLNANCWNSWLP